MRGLVLAAALFSPVAGAVPHVNLYGVCGQTFIVHWESDQILGTLPAHQARESAEAMADIQKAEILSGGETSRVIDLTPLLEERFGFKCPVAM